MAIIVALSMVVLVGFMALAMDVGILFVQQTKLQKAVDAAALAGAQAINLGSFSSGSCPNIDPSNQSASGTLISTLAQQYFGYNSSDIPSTQVTCNEGTVVTAGPCAARCDAWTVTAQSTVPLSFAPVIGFNQATVKATATAIKSPVSGVANPLDFALWAGNGDPTTPSPSDEYCVVGQYQPGYATCNPNGGYPPGSTYHYEYNSNSWISDVVYPNPKMTCTLPCVPNKNWPPLFTSNSFHGFLNNGSGAFLSGTYQVGSTVQNSGGSGSTPALCSAATAGQPLVAPLMGEVTASGGGNYLFHIAAFRVVKLDTANICPTENQGKPWTLTIPTDQTIPNGTPGGTDTNGPVVVMLWQ